LSATRRGGVLGLRGRIVGALLVTTLATLAVAAVALLGPLEKQLRNADLKTLYGDVTPQLQGFQQLKVSAVSAALTSHQGDAQHAVDALTSITGGVATLLAYPQTVVATNDIASAESDAFDDALRAFATGKPQRSFGSSDGKDVARVAIPITLGRTKGVTTSGDGAEQTYVLAVRKPILEVNNAVQAVRKAFIVAALAGLGLTLMLGIAIAATLVRRLRRLRQAALILAEGGSPVEVPKDRARDEVGDLSRTFAIMQGRLQHQEEARRAFVATASHELRTPLASLDGMLELLDDDLRGGAPDLEDARVLLERARAQSRRLARLANDLLDLSKLDAEVALRSEPVELGELSRAVIAELELASRERGVKISAAEGTTPVWALADPGSVAQIVRILLDNAVSVTPAGGEVRISLEPGEVVKLSVADDGPGVPDAEREVIFERFKRGSATRGRGGFGLGLAIGRELAERMGGGLALESGGELEEGVGATFTLALPAARAGVAPALAPH
jgi:signal transduction histidine kinase